MERERKKRETESKRRRTKKRPRTKLDLDLLCPFFLSLSLSLCSPRCPFSHPNHHTTEQTNKQKTHARIDFKIKKVLLDGQSVKLQIWDTAGQERFRTITASYYRGAMGILLVYDVGDRRSFESVRGWMRAVESNAVDGVVRVSESFFLSLGEEENIKQTKASLKSGGPSKILPSFSNSLFCFFSPPVLSFFSLSLSPFTC